MISIHAPARGATCRNEKIESIQVFQFTPLREGRLLIILFRLRQLEISIHAPARGATPPLTHGAEPDTFQFTPLREGRLWGQGRTEIGSVFQFTPLREGRRISKMGFEKPKDFNSRPCERGDAGILREIHSYCTFQFTPLREGRRWTPLLSNCARYFNSRPCERGDAASQAAASFHL